MHRTWQGREALERLWWSDGVVAAERGVTLTDHAVLADELGMAVDAFSGYAPTAFEAISVTTWVRKRFENDGAAVTDAVLCVAGSGLSGTGSLAGAFNGRPFEHPPDPNSGWYSDWVIIPLPGPVAPGPNEVVLHATGDLVFRLYLEPSALPNRSARSIDAGLTWESRRLGAGRFIDGEYILRLSGKRLSAEAILTSPPIQVTPGDSAVGAVGRVTDVAVALDVAAPVEVRLGLGPWLDRPGVWTAWAPLTPDAPATMEQALGEPGPRFVQWRACLRPTGDQTPLLTRADLDVGFDAVPGPAPPAVRIDGPATVLAGRPFAHQRPNERLDAVRGAFEIDAVWREGADDWDRLLRLAAWIGDFCFSWESGPFLRNAPYDVVAILNGGRRKEAKVICGHLAFAFVQLVTAYGHTGRVLLRGNHLATEVWSPVHRKWAVIDPMDQVADPQTGAMSWTPGFGGYYHRGDGVPMSALELGETDGSVTRRHLVWSTGEWQERPATDERDLDWFRREVSYPERNNHTDAAQPIFYADVFRYAGHLKFRRGAEPVMPYYWCYTGRRGDIAWTVGEVTPFLTAVAPDRLLVQVRSQMPNHKQCLISIDGADPVAHEADDYVRTPAGEAASLAVRAVNAFGQEGPPTVIQLGAGDDGTADAAPGGNATGG